MTPAPRDIPSSMNHSPSGTGVSDAPLTAAEFGTRFEAASRALWCIAVGVTGDRTRAEDLVQEAAMVALDKLGDFNPSTSFLAWMGQIVRFLALNERRKMIREREARNDDVFRSAVEPRRTMTDPQSPISGKGELSPEQLAFDDDLAAAVSALDETARSCLLLRTVMSLTYREIGLALSIPEGTAMSHVHRARQTLRKQLTAPKDAASSRRAMP